MYWLLSFLILLLIAGISGALGMALGGKRGRGGCLLSIAVGFIGALIGSLIAGYFGLPEPLPVRVAGTTFPIVWSIAGGAIFVAILNLISRPVP